MEKVRFNTYLAKDVHTQLVSYAERMGISQSAAMNLILSTYFEGQKGMTTLSDLMTAYKSESMKKVEGETA